MSAQQELNRVLIDWDTALRAYAKAAEESAAAEADHKRLRARVIVKEKHADPKITLTLCEALAEANDEVATALNRRLVAEATADAIRGKLKWFQAAADAKRSEVSSERQNAQLYATNGPGA